jgi:hypothetical protein
MSMEIDYSTPLTQEERAYLRERGKYGDEARADAMHGVDTPPDDGGDGTGLVPVSALTSDQMAGERDRLRARLAELDAAEGVDDEDDEDVLPPYEEWKVTELRKEAGNRNLDKSGDVPTLAARLREYDAAALAATE